MKKTMIVNDVAPPVVQGGAIMLGKYLELFSTESYCILTGRIGKDRFIDPQRWLSGKYFFHYIPNYNGTNPIFCNIFILLDILLILLRGFWIAKKEKIDNILALSNRGTYLVAGFIISRIMHRAFFIFLTDAYEQLPRYKTEKIMQRLLEKTMFRSVTKLFVLNEFLQQHYFKKYGIRAKVLPVPVEFNSDARLEVDASLAESRKTKKIVFSGMVYWAQKEAIKNLVDVVNSLEEETVKLFIYTSSSSKELARNGIGGKNVVISFAKREDLKFIHNEADILFLPLSFNVPYPLLIKTASTTKLPEYLISGRPILVHAPRDCFVSYYGKKEGFGYIVNDNNPAQLKEAVTRLLNDKLLQESLVKNAQKLACRHDVRKLSVQLMMYLSGD